MVRQHRAVSRRPGKGKDISVPISSAWRLGQKAHMKKGVAHEELDKDFDEVSSDDEECQSPSIQVPREEVTCTRDSFPGGPHDRSVIRDFSSHVAYEIWRGNERKLLKVHAHGKKLQNWLKTRLPLPVQVSDGVKQAKLTSLMFCSLSMVDNAMISAFVERWHRETSSFHLPFGEMTITLDDVACLLGIPLTGNFFVMPVMDSEVAVCVMESILGISSEDATNHLKSQKGVAMSISWLMDLYDYHRSLSQWEFATKALIMVILGCTILADKSQNRINVRYLDLVREPSTTWSWGVIALTQLYTYLGDASLSNITQIGGYMTLLQAWIYEYFPPSVFKRKEAEGYDEKLPRAHRWTAAKGLGDVEPHRRSLDSLSANDIIWTPWISHRHIADFEEVSLYSGYIRCGNVFVPYLPERVLRQFGYRQEIPRLPPLCPPAGEIFTAWQSLHSVRRMIQLNPATCPSECVGGYLEWFFSVSHPLCVNHGVRQDNKSAPSLCQNAICGQTISSLTKRLEKLADILRTLQLDNTVHRDKSLCIHLSQALQIAEGERETTSRSRKKSRPRR